MSMFTQALLGNDRRRIVASMIVVRSIAVPTTSTVSGAVSVLSFSDFSDGNLLLPLLFQFLLPTNCYLLHTADCLLLAAYYLLPSTDYLLPLAFYLLPTTH